MLFFSELVGGNVTLTDIIEDLGYESNMFGDTWLLLELHVLCSGSEADECTSLIIQNRPT